MYCCCVYIFSSIAVVFSLIIIIFFCILVKLLKFVLHLTDTVSYCQFTASRPAMEILILLLLPNWWFLCNPSLFFSGSLVFSDCCICISTISLLKPVYSYFRDHYFLHSFETFSFLTSSSNSC